MKRLSHILLAASFVAFSALPARAQNTDIAALRDGETILNISATERQQVEQDMLMASLSVTVDGQNPTALQDQVNRAMKKALDTARTYKDVQTSTQQYYVYQYEIPQPQPVENKGTQSERKMIWRATQSLDLRGKNSDALLDLAGQLQADGLQMSGLSYYLSTEKMEEATDRMMDAALAKLQKRANEAAASLKKSSASLVEVTVNEGGNYYPVPMMAMKGAEMAQDSMQAPQAASGMSELNLTVSARALLKP
jgi:uncharacterized protein